MLAESKIVNFDDPMAGLVSLRKHFAHMIVTKQGMCLSLLQRMWRLY